MTDTDIDTLITKIKTLTNNDAFGYLQLKSTWFSESFVDTIHKDKYPYVTNEFDTFFLDTSISKFDKEIGLKFLVNEGMNNHSYDKTKIATWIIKIWGGIKGIGSNSLQDIVDNLNKKDYLFKNISSWSKVHSFKDIKEDVIYDSKVIYSLNWLLLHLDSNPKYFLQPEGRNRKLIAFPMNAIINFKHNNLIDMSKTGSKATDKVYLDKNEVYTKYKLLVQQLNTKLWSDETIDLTKLIGHEIYLRDYPFFTELLLFNMADDVVVKDVQHSVSINMNLTFNKIS